MRPPHALSGGRLAALGATRGFTTGCQTTRRSRTLGTGPWLALQRREPGQESVVSRLRIPPSSPTGVCTALQHRLPVRFSPRVWGRRGTVNARPTAGTPTGRRPRGTDPTVGSTIFDKVSIWRLRRPSEPQAEHARVDLAIRPSSPRCPRPSSPQSDSTRGGEFLLRRACQTTTDEPFRSPHRGPNPDRSALQRADARGNRHRDGARQLDARSGRHTVRALPAGLAGGRPSWPD